MNIFSSKAYNREILNPLLTPSKTYNGKFLTPLHGT